MENLHANTSGKEFVLTRVFQAPRELVFTAFTQAEHLAKWWGPKGFTVEVYKLDVRPGGIFHYSMTAENGYKMYGIFVYHEVKKPEKVVFVNSFSDEHGDIVKPPFPDPWPLEILNIWTFTEDNGRTTLTLRGWAYNASEEEQATYEAGQASMNEGFGGTFDQLDAYLLTLTDEPFTIERTYNAPITKVWEAITNKEHMKHWYFDLAEFKPEVGFQFQFTGQGNDGVTTYVHLCEVIKVEPQRKLAYTWTYQGLSGRSEVTWELFPEGDKTRLKLTHSGLGSFPVHPDFRKQSFAEGWTYILGTSLEGFLQQAKA